MQNKKQYSDEQLISGCLKNDRYFQEQLYRKYFPSMMRMCLKYTQDKEKAMDIVNDGMLRVFKKIDKFSFKGSLEGWMRKLVYHSLSDYFRKHKNYLNFMVFEEKEESTSNAEPLNNLYWDDLVALVHNTRN